MDHSFSVCKGVCLGVFACLVGCNGPSSNEGEPHIRPPADELPLAAPRAPDLRLGGLQFRHRISGPALAFSPDGKTLFSAGTDGTIREWEVPAGQLRRVLGGRRGELRALALAPNGLVLAAGGKDGQISMWDLSANKELWSAKAHVEAITSIAFAEEGRSLVSAGQDGLVRVLDVSNGSEVRCLVKQESGAVVTAVSPDGKAVALSSNDQSVRILKVCDGTEVKRFGGIAHAEAICFSPDGRQVVAAGGSTQISILNSSSHYRQ